MRRHGVARAAFVALVLLALVASARLEVVSAECDGPYPSFTTAVRTATRVLIGQVVAVDAGPDAPLDEAGRSSRFVLRGWSILEGDQVVELRIEDLQSQPCAGYVAGRVGDVIALAVGGHDFQPPQVVNAVAWIEGVRPERDGIETVTIADVYRLLGRPMPDPLPNAEAGVETPSSDSDLALPLLVLGAALIALLLACGVAWWRSSR